MTLLFHSVTLASMVIMIYLAFSILPTQALEGASFLVIKLRELATVTNFFSYYVYVLLIGILCTLLAVFYEKRFYRIK